MEGNLLNQIGDTYKNPNANIVLNGEILNFILWLGARQRCLFLSLIFHCTEVLVGVLIQWKEIKYTPIGKNEVIMSLLTNDIRVYVESPEEFTKKAIKPNK